MVTFWVICTLLILVALIIILPSLLAKETVDDLDRQKINRAVYEKKLKELENDLINDLIDRDQFEIAKSDLQRTLIDDIADQKELILKKDNKVLPIIIVLIVPVAAILIYLKLNNGLISLSPNFQTQMQAQQQGQMQSVEQAIKNLEQKLKENPNNIDGWMMLGRTYLMQEKFDASVEAYRNANELSNSANPDILVAYGEAKVFAAGQKFDESTRSLFDRALQIDPDFEKGLWYAGLAAYQFEDYKSAIDYWEKLIQFVPADQEQVKSALEIYLSDAKQKAGIEVASSPSENNESSSPKSTSKNEASITVSVSLSDEFHNKYVNSDTLFIYARAKSGPRMPLALVKMTAGDLPTTVTLDDSVSMMPGMTLSSMDQVEVIARISKSGQAIMQSGDIFGSVQSVNTNKSETVDVVISELVP